MEGPRHVLEHELSSLGQLVDATFLSGRKGAMQAAFPALFNVDNLHNLQVFVENGRIVSHVGRTERWASLCGCTVRVACIGAVATDEAHRGRSLATRLLAASCEEAKAGGVDFMMISGGRGLYRRTGAVDAGLDHRVTVELPAARALTVDGFDIRPYVDADLPFWIDAYQRKIAHFIRPAEDWEWAMRSRKCQGHDTDFFSITRAGVVCGYLVCRESDRHGTCTIMEFAGDDGAVAAALPPLAAHYHADAVRIHVQGTQPTLAALLTKTGATLDPAHALGTLLVLNFPQLVDRLRPWFEARAGMDVGRSVGVRLENEIVVFSAGQESLELASRAGATECLFGNHERDYRSGVFANLFPVPSLWYGLNYV